MPVQPPEPPKPPKPGSRMDSVTAKQLYELQLKVYELELNLYELMRRA